MESLMETHVLLLANQVPRGMCISMGTCTGSPSGLRRHTGDSEGTERVQRYQTKLTCFLFSSTLP